MPVFLSWTRGKWCLRLMDLDSALSLCRFNGALNGASGHAGPRLVVVDDPRSSRRHLIQYVLHHRPWVRLGKCRCEGSPLARRTWGAGPQQSCWCAVCVRVRACGRVMLACSSAGLSWAPCRGGFHLAPAVFVVACALVLASARRCSRRCVVSCLLLFFILGSFLPLFPRCRRRRVRPRAGQSEWITRSPLAAQAQDRLPSMLLSGGEKTQSKPSPSIACLCLRLSIVRRHEQGASHAAPG